MAVILLEIAGMMALAGKPMPEPDKLPPAPIPEPAFGIAAISQAVNAELDVDLAGAYFF